MLPLREGTPEDGRRGGGGWRGPGGRQVLGSVISIEEGVRDGGREEGKGWVLCGRERRVGALEGFKQRGDMILFTFKETVSVESGAGTEGGVQAGRPGVGRL